MDELISVDAAHVRVSGSEHKEHGGFRTTATATVEDLNVLEVVTADRIVAQVSLMHYYDHRPVEVSLLGSRFVNLQVNGSPVSVNRDPRMFGIGRETELSTNAPAAEELLRVAENQFSEGMETQRRLIDRFGERFAFKDPQKDLEENGDALCTIVQPVSIDAPAEAYGHVIHLPDFGNIFLGELRLNRFAAELTMLRLEMGCIAEGSLSICSSGPNGRWCP